MNRGFLNGPFLPIYGFGAIAILWATLPVRNSIALIYLFGMLSATILEYVTGAAMERLFRVRYWDYSKHKFNLNGHICLGVSLGWGLFAVFLVKGIHLPIESLILQIPPLLGDILGNHTGCRDGGGCHGVVQRGNGSEGDPDPAEREPGADCTAAAPA